jgi:hypothetical protein
MPDDRQALLEVLSNAQFVYGLSRYPKQQVVGNPVQMKTLRERLETMRGATARLTNDHRKGLEAELALLEAIDSGTDAVWKAAKRATPKIIDRLAPLVRDDPEAAFLISGVTKRGRAAAAEAEDRRPTPLRPEPKQDTGLSGKEIAGLQLVIQERANADDDYHTWLRGNHSLPIAEWRRRRAKVDRARRAEDAYIDKLFKSRSRDNE